MALPSSPINGEVGYLNGNQYQFDAYTSRWLIVKTNFSTTELENVSSDVLPEENSVLVWDSDNSLWVPGSIQQALGATALKVESFTASSGQTEFILRQTPISDVAASRNGVQLRADAVSVLNKVVTLDEEVDEDDWITIAYNVGSNVGFSAELNDLDDLDYDYSSLSQNDVLGWDTSSSTFKSYNLQERLTEIEGDIAQAVADRVFTDNNLSARISDHDSDIATKGRFFVQATPPNGGPNSGWVNTTNMRLYVWDTEESTWVQTNLT